MRRCALLFVSLSALYHSNLRPIASGDSLATWLIPFSVVLDGSPRLDRFGPYIAQNVSYGKNEVRQIERHWYGRFPIAGPLLASPLYVPLALVPAIRRLPS